MVDNTRVSLRSIVPALFVLALLGAGAREAHAFSSGITTASFGPLGCNGCHSGGVAPMVMLSGPTAVAAHSTNEYLFEVFATGAQIYAGLNASATGGTLSLGGSQSAQTQILPGPGAVPEVTHASPKLNVAGVTSFTFHWTAPSPVTMTTINVWGNAVNFSGSPFGDAATMTSIVITPSTADTDGDSVQDGVDNCPDDPNTLQEDADGDTWGDACDVDPDCADPTNADTDGDGIGDACDACPMNPAPCNCGDGIVDPDEECDLGTVLNGQTGQPCSADCQVVGNCAGGSQAGDPCTNDLDCSGGTCCGDGSVSAPEQCDDGNDINDDTCDNTCTTVAGGVPLVGCDGLFGSQIVAATVKVAKFKDKNGNSQFDDWKTKGSFTPATGTTVDADSETVRVVFNQSTALFDKSLAPGSFAQSGSSGKEKWKFSDPEADVPGGEGLRKAKLKHNAAAIDNLLQGRGVEIAVDTTSPIRLRQTIRIGSVCATTILSCEAKGGGKTLKCTAP